MMYVNLDGPDGNAFVLLGMAQKLSKRNDVNKTSKEIIDEMKSGDYNHLVGTFNKYFSHLVELQTTKVELTKVLLK